MPPENPEKRLLKFILEARERNFDDFQIKDLLIKNSWPKEVVEKAFAYLNKTLEVKEEKLKSKAHNAITIYLDDKVIKMINKRAKKNMMDFNEQIEDILRRSCLNLKKQRITEDKTLDDKFIALFSRKNTGKPKKII
jgi:glutamate/tyrosine decarboxylase-like PLP-dependent enzyme